MSSQIPGLTMLANGLIPTPPSTYPPLYYYGADNPPHPSRFAHLNAFWGAGLGTGSAYVYDERRPMLRQLDYQWAGTYPKKQWDPLTFYRGYPAAPFANDTRLGTYMRAQPVHNGLGYQNVLMRDNGVPVGGEPASTPNYMFAGPIQIGFMDFQRPVARQEQMPAAAPTAQAVLAAQNQAMVGVYGGGPFSRPPLQPPGYATEAGGIQGDFPVYQVRPTQPPNLPPPTSSPPQEANANPGRVPTRKDTMRNWTSPNDFARMQRQAALSNPMPGSGPGYHGYISRNYNGMAGAAPGYATQVINPAASLSQWMRGVARQPNPAITAPATARAKPNCPPGYHRCGSFCCKDVRISGRSTIGRSHRRHAATQTISVNPGGGFLVRGQVVPKERGLFCRLFSRSTQCKKIATSSPIPRRVPRGNPGVVPKGTYPQWSGQAHRARIDPNACCSSCALGQGCEGGKKPTENPCGCGGGTVQNPCPCIANRAA